MFSTVIPTRPAGAAALISGVVLTGLGVAAAVEPTIVGGAWFVVAGLAAELLVVAVLGLRASVDGIRGARGALTAAAAGLALFGLAHFYALVDEDTAILLFSVFMIVASVGMIVAGVVVARASVRRGGRRFVPLLCGVWPIATIPAGAALGDLPHFLAIAGWGLCWTALGLTLLTAAASSSRPAMHPAS
jgi:hypothetical protein